MRFNQTHVNLMISLMSVSELSTKAAKQLIVSLEDDDTLQLLEDASLNLALKIREYRRPKNIMEKKGQRA